MMSDYDTWNWIAIFTLEFIPDLDKHRIHENLVNEIFAILELSFGIFTKGTRPQCIENSKSGPTAFDLYVDPVLSIAILIWIICLEHRLEDKMVRFGPSCSLQHLQCIASKMKCRIYLKWFITISDYLLSISSDNFLNLGLFMSCSTTFFRRLT